MTYLLDTDTCVYWLRGRQEVRSRLEAVPPTEATISIVTLCELRYGAACSADPGSNQRVIDDFVADMPIWGVDAAVAAAYAEIKAELRRTGKLIEDFDLLLAATALTNHLTLVTKNVAHFGRVGNISLETWITR